jgi:hypothetical protein
MTTPAPARLLARQSVVIARRERMRRNRLAVAAAYRAVSVAADSDAIGGRPLNGDGIPTFVDFAAADLALASLRLATSAQLSIRRASR